MYKRSVRRRRAVLALLVGLSIALLTAYFGESASGGLHAIQRGFLQALAPFQEGASRALKPARDLVGWTGDVFDAKSENKKLAAVRELRAGSPIETASREAKELRAMVGFNRSAGFPDGYDPVAARVIARSPTVWYSAITIDKGSDQGVRVNQPVVSGDGPGRAGSPTSRRMLPTSRSSPTTRAASRRRSCPTGERDREGDGRKSDGPDPRLREKGRARPEGCDGDHVRVALVATRVALPRGIPIGSVTRSDSMSASSISGCTSAVRERARPGRGRGADGRPVARRRRRRS